MLKNSLTQYERNNFATWLIDSIGAEGATRLIERYYLGTSKHWSGASIFWQIDHMGNVRTGKVMLYNTASGRRVKEPFNHIAWVHKVLNVESYEQVYFGSHLLNKPENLNKPVAIVESEKTAVIASHYFNQFIWLACGGLSMLSKERCEHLKGRKVVLWPDLNCFDKWQAKAEIMGFLCSDFLELRASETDKEKGLDLADYLTRINNKPQAEPQHEPEPLSREKSEKSERSKTNIICEKKEPLPQWARDFDRESLWWFFLDEPAPKKPIAIDENEYIVNFDDYVSERINALDSTASYNDLNLLAQYLTYVKI